MVQSAVRVLKNTTILSASVLLERLVNVVLQWYFIWTLDETLWGSYSTAQAVILFGATIGPWGLNLLLPREVARKAAKSEEKGPLGRLASDSIALSLLTGLCIALITIAVVRLTGRYDATVTGLITIGTLFVLVPYMETLILAALFIGLEASKYIIFARLPLSILRVLFSILALALGWPIESLFIIWGIFNVAVVGVLLRIYQRQVVSIPLRPNFDSMWQLAQAGTPFVLPVVATSLFTYAGAIILGSLRHPDEVAIYATGIQLILLFYLLAPQIMESLYAPLARSFDRSEREFERVVNLITVLIILLFFPLSLGSFAIADLIIPLLFNERYLASIPVMQIASLGILPSFMSRFFYRATTAGNREWRLVGVALFAGTVTLVANFLLIPRFSYIGTAWAGVLTILANLIFNGYNVTRFVKIDWINTILKPLGAVAAASLLYWGLFSVGLYPVLALFPALALFLGLFWLSGLLRRENLTLFFKRKET